MTSLLNRTFVYCLVLFSSMATAQPIVEVPDNIKGVTTLTAETLIETANSIEQLVLIDSRLSEDRAVGYIEESISLADIETTCETLSEAIPELHTPAAFYCNGIQCGRSVRAIEIAKSCKYSNLYWFKGGIEEWKAKNYPLAIE